MTNPIDRRAFLRRGAVVLGGAVVLPSILAACGDDDDGSVQSSSATTAAGSSNSTSKPDYGSFDYQFSWIKNVEFAGMYIADTEGYYTDEGFTSVNFLAGGPNVQQDAIVASGNALVGISGPDICAAAILQGAELIALGAQYQKNPFCVMSLTDNPINVPEDMYGKSIGVQSVNEPVWNAFLTAAGLDASQINKVPAQFDPQPLVNKEVDGWFSFVTNEPNLLKVQGIDTVNLLLNDHGYPLVTEIYVVRKETLANERDKLKAILRADVRGWRDSIKDPAIAAKLVVEKYGKDLGLDEAEQVLESKAQNELIYTGDVKTEGLFTISDELLEQTMATLKLGGIEIEQEQLFDLSLINELYEENPELKEPIV